MTLTLKKSAILASALISAVSANAATVYEKDGNSLDIFGSVQALFLSKHSANPDRYYQNAAADGSISSATTLGLAMRSNIAHNLDAIALVQWDMPDGELDEHNNYTYVGFDAYQYGTLIMGKAENAYYAVCGVTDIYNYLESRGNDYYAMGDKSPGMIMYRFSALSWDLRLSYQTAKEEVNGTPFNISHAYAFSVSGMLNDKISLAYGLSYTDFSYAGREQRANLQGYFAPIYAKDYKVSDAEGALLAQRQMIEHKYDYGFSIAYGVLGEGLYGALSYTASDYEYLKHTLHSWELASSYTFDNGLELLGGLSYLTYNGINVTLDLNLGLAWNLSPTFKVFCESAIDLGAEPERFYGTGTEEWMAENKFILGAQFSF